MENAGTKKILHHNLALCFKLSHIHSCDAEYSGPACLPTSVLGELREDFSGYPLSSTLWSSVTGNNGNLNSRCGMLTGKPDVNTTKELV